MLNETRPYIDQRNENTLTGRKTFQTLGYHTPVNADINQLDVLFVEERDQIVNELGVKGVGEIGILALVPAIANAIFHATGKRIRDLPITLDKVMRPENPNETQ